MLLIGAGVGTTPIRALLAELPRDADVVSIVRGSSPRAIVLRDEIATLVRDRGGRHHELVGPRERVAIDAGTLRARVPDLRERDVFLCGPDGFTAEVIAALHAAGVPAAQIHHESFVF